MDFAAADEDGITPLHIAVLNAGPAVTDAALAGADPDIAEGGLARPGRAGPAPAGCRGRR